MKFEDALKCMRERKEVKYRNDVYYIDKKGRLRVRYSDVEMRLIPCFTAEQIMSEEWEINMLKNQKKINISEGNVKDDNIKSGKTKHGDFIVKYLEEGSHYKVKEINVMENVAQRNSQDLEQVADTINHIADISKKLSLKYLWSKRELDGAYYIKNGNGEYEVQIFQDKRKDYRFIGSPISEFVCEVPSYEQWQPFTDPYFKGLTTKDIAELAKKSIRLTKQSCEDNTTIQRLKELLDHCADILEEMDDKDEILLEEVNEALK